MRPIPPGFCEAADNAAIPGRPWWRAGHGRWVRRDGPYVFVGEDPFPEPATAANNGGTLRMSAPSRDRIVEAVERIDADHPLPHPGYRAGQVWLVSWGVAWDLHVIGHTRNERIVTAQTDKAGVIGFLLHDPLMPSKAPWGPS